MHQSRIVRFALAGLMTIAGARSAQSAEDIHEPAWWESYRGLAGSAAFVSSIAHSAVGLAHPVLYLGSAGLRGVGLPGGGYAAQTEADALEAHMAVQEYQGWGPLGTFAFQALDAVSPIPVTGTRIAIAGSDFAGGSYKGEDRVVQSALALSGWASAGAGGLARARVNVNFMPASVGAVAVRGVQQRRWYVPGDVARVTPSPDQVTVGVMGYAREGATHVRAVVIPSRETIQRQADAVAAHGAQATWDFGPGDTLPPVGGPSYATASLHDVIALASMPTNPMLPRTYTNAVTMLDGVDASIHLSRQDWYVDHTVRIPVGAMSMFEKAVDRIAQAYLGRPWTSDLRGAGAGWRFGAANCQTYACEIVNGALSARAAYQNRIVPFGITYGVRPFSVTSGGQED